MTVGLDRHVTISYKDDIQITKGSPIKSGACITIDAVRDYLRQCGYAEDLLRPDFEFGGNRKADLAAFAHAPVDARSACIAAIEATGDIQQNVSACRGLGSPVVIVITSDALQLWKQLAARAELVENVPAAKASAFFRSRKEDLSPGAIYRAKTWGRLEHKFQLSFVDAGLMPLVENETGERLKSLIERVVLLLQRRLWPNTEAVLPAQGHWLLKRAFWLLAAKILRDKQVPGFISLDFSRVEDVFGRVARHYDSGQVGAASTIIRTSKERGALEEAAQEIAQFGHLGNLTTESLACVYESTLIDKATRAKLGTHSTPPYLVDYVVGKLAPWIKDIPADERDALEPACGHAAFLVAAMRLLKELLPAERQPDRKQYLRSHLHGIEVDSFAVEIARLSLTLADIPNPNGWDLNCQDMFSAPLATKAKQATILLGNPPFEDFSALDRRSYARKDIQLQHVNKTAEVLSQVLPALRPGGVFGFVVPQGLLHSKNADTLRKRICEDFEISEICLFPDKVFSFSGAETAVIIGRRLPRRPMGHLVSFRRVREPDMPRFRLDYFVSSKQKVPQASFNAATRWVLLLPELGEVWASFHGQPTLADVADVGEGLSYGPGRPSGTRTWSSERFPGAVKGYAGPLGRKLLIHDLPPEVWMNVAPEALGPARRGADLVPQVLFNHVRVGRGPWRIKAFIDREGRAFTNNYCMVRPRQKSLSLELLWAILNSPLCNAFAFAHATGKHNLPGTIGRMPLPAKMAELDLDIAPLVRRYQEVASEWAGPLSGATDRARSLMLEIDARVLRAYELPPRQEREVLDLFVGRQRAGVPFRFDRYFPDGFESWIPLHEYLSEEYLRSTAGALHATHEDVSSPELLEALRRASEDFEE